MAPTPNAQHRFMFPPFPPVPTGATVISFKDFKENDYDGPEVDALGISTLLLGCMYDEGIAMFSFDYTLYRNSLLDNKMVTVDPQLVTPTISLMPLTYVQFPFEHSWLQTDGGIDEENYDAEFSRYLHLSLRTKFLWHFAPTYLSVQGTAFEQSFLIRASAIWASHWPEDVTYGEKPVHERTALMKRVIYPAGFSSGDLDIEDIELHLGMNRYDAQAVKRDQVAQMTLHNFFADNIRTYQRILQGYSNDETKKMWYQLMNSIRTFLLQAVTNFGQYIVSYGLPASAWQSSLDEAVLFWDLHNHLPASFHQECFSWPRYRYLTNVPEEGPHRLLAWEYPLADLAAGMMELPPPWLPL
ncbi:hypothetical protein C8R41DRAFT_871780 [Lentinula lateritia]|uniref:Uncharacterized protein n=1 Tax=Lentinula lateritia TaxID=40482 RepID=A0ABQ8UYC7_9AGAR|nr:hypothetical protein C8R41DRAFT_871780 [Lentinula lateritia]